MPENVSYLIAVNAAYPALHINILLLQTSLVDGTLPIPRIRNWWSSWRFSIIFLAYILPILLCVCSYISRHKHLMHLSQNTTVTPPPSAPTVALNINYYIKTYAHVSAYEIALMGFLLNDKMRARVFYSLPNYFFSRTV